jgi:integrase
MKADALDVVLFDNYLKEKRNLKESSRYTYTRCIEAFLKFNPDIDKLEDYNNFIIKYAVKKRSRNYYSILKTFIEWKIDDNSLKKEIIENIVVPPIDNNIKKEKVYLDEDKIIEVINALKSKKHQLISLIMHFTGVRAGDILRLKRGNIVNEEYNGEPILQIKIEGKGSKRNVVTIHDEVLQELIINYIGDNFTNDEYYFIESRKTKKRKSSMPDTFYMVYKYNYDNFLKDLKNALIETGVEYDKFATHDLRRCFARRVWEKWKDLTILQSLLRHGDPKTTMRYLQQSGLKNIDYYKEMQS